MQRNGHNGPIGLANRLNTHMEWNGADNQGFWKAIEAFQEAKGNIYDLAKNANLPDGAFPAIASLYTRGMTRLKRNGKNVNDILNDRDKWHELPLPLVIAINYCVSSSADDGLSAMQAVMWATSTAIVPKRWQKDYKAVKFDQEKDIGDD